MDALRRLIRLMRHPGFRRLVMVRALSQGGDAIIQVGMASYILFNPQSQTNAWAIAAVIALIMLPFSVVGPFVSPILDRFSRQRIVVTCDLTRMVLALAMTALVVTGHVGLAWQTILLVLLLVTLGLNRLQIAALSAGMPLTVEPREYLDAAAVMPMLGPASGLAGGLLAGLARLASGRILPANWADGLVFMMASLLFITAALLASRFKHRQLGPAADAPVTSWAQVFSGLSVGGRELLGSRPALTGVLMVFSARVGYGLLMTAIIVLYRHHFGSDATAEQVMIEMGTWFVVSGAGFALSGLVTAPVAARIGVRRAMVASFGIAAVVQLMPGSLLNRPSLLVAGFILGLCLQAVKICTDTILQAHIADSVRGRVMVIYDIINNLGYVVGAFVAAALLPPDGRSVPVFVGLGLAFALLAVVLEVISRPDAASYDRGTVRDPRNPHNLVTEVD